LYYSDYSVSVVVAVRVERQGQTRSAALERELLGRPKRPRRVRNNTPFWVSFSFADADEDEELKITIGASSVCFCFAIVFVMLVFSSTIQEVYLYDVDTLWVSRYLCDDYENVTSECRQRSLLSGSLCKVWFFSCFLTKFAQVSAR
jgi:hypothetical protein